MCAKYFSAGCTKLVRQFTADISVNNQYSSNFFSASFCEWRLKRIPRHAEWSPSETGESFLVIKMAIDPFTRFTCSGQVDQ